MVEEEGEEAKVRLTRFLASYRHLDSHGLFGSAAFDLRAFSFIFFCALLASHACPARPAASLEELCTRLCLLASTPLWRKQAHRALLASLD